MDSSCSATAAAPAGLTVQVCFPAARAAVLDNLNRQREEGRLCDLSIQVQGQVFRAHRCVLAASSPYFHDQVLLKNVTTVSLPSVMDPLAFESVLSSAYTGQLSIVHDDIVNYVTVASFLQMWHIVDKCTEILKRSRPPADPAQTDAAAVAAAAAAHSGTASRQQSPSSTDCLYVEREGRRRERRPDALPPLATWRRPQQFPRWGRQRPPAPQHTADSQLDGVAAYGQGEYAGSEEAWGSGAVRAAHLAHEGPHAGRQQGAPLSAEAARQRGRWQQRGAGPNDKSRESREMEEAPERKNERREIEADEGVGEETEEEKKKELSHCELGPVLSDEARPAAAAGGKASAEETREKTPRVVTGSDLTSELPSGPGPSGGAPARAPWQTGPWSQPEPRPLEGGVCDRGEEEEEVDFECLAQGAFSRDTYDEIQDGTGQVSQRPLLPASPDFTMAGSEGSWPAPCGSPPATRHLPASSAAFPPPPSPPTPSSSSSSVSLAGAPYSGKVHFCHCGKAYTLKSMRDRHVKMQHLNLRPFGCPVCTKSFKMKHHLTKHLKTHGGLRPYECSVCGKKVIWRDSFLRHQARCQRLAHSSAHDAASAAEVDEGDGYGYAFEDGEAFLAMGGAVKVEEADFSGEMGGLLGSVSGMVDELAGQSQSLEGGAQVFKEEASESFSRS